MRLVRPHYLAIILALFAVVVWSSALIGIGLALRDIAPGPLVFLRFCVASLCFLGMAATGKVSLPDQSDIPSLFMLGALGHAVYQLALSFAQTKITAGVAGVIISLVPVFSALLAILVLREKLSKRGWLGMIIAFGGVLLISLHGVSSTASLNPWVLVGVISAAASAGYFILQKPFLTRYSALDITAYGVWAATLIMAVFLPRVPQALAASSHETVLAVLYLGIVPTAVGYTLWSMALARASATQVSSMLYLEPIITFILAWVILGEIPTFYGIIGAVCALFGVFLVAARDK